MEDQSNGIQVTEQDAERQEEQTDEAQANRYDASKYERPSVTVDVVMMSLRQRDLQFSWSSAAHGRLRECGPSLAAS